MSEELLYQIALTRIPGIGPVQARLLIDKFVLASEIFKARRSHLEHTEGIGVIRAHAIASFKDFSSIQQELRFIEKHKISALFLTDEDYPRRLLNCYDPPTLLFFRGNTTLNAPRMIAVIGTRNNSDYGKQITENLIRDLIEFAVVIVSGLAYGIDAIAHRSALKYNLPTVAALAHGMGEIYPPQHNQLACDMLSNGGVLTEFCGGTRPDKHNFPTRNRIVAGMTDATVVIETGVKGGSMITAELAGGYNRDVFAFPGKITDSKSAGCNYLIKNNKAILLTDATQFADWMGWVEKSKSAVKKQRSIFVELSPGEQIVLDLISEHKSAHVDHIHLRSKLSTSAVAAAILSLELQNLITSLPGKMYALA